MAEESPQKNSTKSKGAFVDITKLNDLDIEANIKLPYIKEDVMLMAPGVWNDTYYGPKEVVGAFHRTDWEDKRVRNLFWDHEDVKGETWIGEVVNPRVIEEERIIRGDLLILDKQAAINLDWGAKMGISPKALGFEDFANNMLNFKFGNFSVVIDPAVKLAYINNSQNKIKKEEIKMAEKVEETKPLAEEVKEEVKEEAKPVEEKPVEVAEEPKAEEAAPAPVEAAPAPASGESSSSLSDDSKVMKAIENLSAIVTKLGETVAKMAESASPVEKPVEKLPEEVPKVEEMKVEPKVEEMKVEPKVKPESLSLAEDKDQFKEMQEKISELSNKIKEFENEADKPERASMAVSNNLSQEETVNPDVDMMNYLRSQLN